MDSFDVMILNLLRSNGRISNRKLAESVHLTASSVLKRVRALEKSGIIQGYTTRVNPMRLGLDMAVIIEVITSEGAGILNAGKNLASFPEVCDVYDVSGRVSYIVKAMVRNTEALNDLIVRIGKVPGVARTQSTLIMNSLKNELSVEVSCE